MKCTFFDGSHSLLRSCPNSTSQNSLWKPLKAFLKTFETPRWVMVENLIWSVDSRWILGEKLPVDFRWISGNHNETAGGFPVDFQFSLFFTERPVMHFLDQTCFSPSFHRGFHHFFTIFSPQFSPFFHPSFHSSFHSRFSQQVFTPVFTEIFIEVLRFSPTCSVVDFWLIGLRWLISG